MENEENRGLINKNAYEYQWARLGQFSFGDLSLFFLSHTLGHLEFFLEHFGIGARNEKKARGSKDQVRKGRIKQRQ